MGVFSKSRLTSTRQTGSPDSISTETNSHLELSTASHSFSDSLVPFQKSPPYLWAQEKHSSLDVKGNFTMSSAKYLRQGRKSTEGSMNFIHLLLSTHRKCLCPLIQCLVVNVLNISIPLGITCCLHFRSIFKGEAGGWRSQAGLNHNCCGLTSLDKQSIFWNYLVR